MEERVEKNKQKFLELIKNNIHREGVDGLVDYLLKSDFFTAPASTRFHSNFEGGLCEHSIKVFEKYTKLLELEYGKDWQNEISLESATIIALFHDVCKVDTYITDYRNVKENGEWVKKPFYAVNDKLPYGHGEKSVYIVNGFMRLTRDEAMAINWHMGAFDERAKNNPNILKNVFQKFPIAYLTHIADYMATYLDEEVVE